MSSIKCVDCDNYMVGLSKGVEMCLVGLWDRTDEEQEWLKLDEDFEEPDTNEIL